MDVHALSIRAVLGPLWARWEGSPYLAHYRGLRRTQFDSRETVRARRWAGVRAQTRHAFAPAPFSRQRLAEAGLRPGDFRTPDDYRRLPVLTKADIRSRGAALRSTAFHGAALRR